MFRYLKSGSCVVYASNACVYVFSCITEQSIRSWELLGLARKSANMEIVCFFCREDAGGYNASVADVQCLCGLHAMPVGGRKDGLTATPIGNNSKTQLCILLKNLCK